MTREYSNEYLIKCSADLAKMFLQNKQVLNFGERSDEDFLLFLLYKTVQSLSSNFSDTMVIPNELYTTNNFMPVEPPTSYIAPMYPQDSMNLIDVKVDDPDRDGSDPLFHFDCVKCKKRFKTKAYLQKHHKRCRENILKRYHCQYCPLVYSSMGALNDHLREKHRDVRYSCEICNKKFKSMEYVKQHIRVAHKKIKDHKCPQCEKMFTQRGSLKIHIQMVHQKLRAYTCRICNKPFGCKSHLTRHMSRMHGSVKDLSCEMCGSIFSTVQELNTHQDEHHYHTELICNMCNKSFRQKHTLTAHIAKYHSDSGLSGAHQPPGTQPPLHISNKSTSVVYSNH